MSSITKRLDEIESQLKVVASSKKKWECRGKPPEFRQSRTTNQSEGQSTRTVVCFKCSQEGHFARGCAARQRPEGGKQLNAVSEPSSQNKEDPQDAIPAVSYSVNNGLPPTGDN